MTLLEEIIARFREDKSFQKHWSEMRPKLLELILGMQQQVSKEPRPADQTPEEHDQAVGRNIRMLTNLTETLNLLTVSKATRRATPERPKLNRQHDNE